MNVSSVESSTSRPPRLCSSRESRPFARKNSGTFLGCGLCQHETSMIKVEGSQIHLARQSSALVAPLSLPAIIKWMIMNSSSSSENTIRLPSRSRPMTVLPLNSSGFGLTVLSTNGPICQDENSLELFDPRLGGSSARM